MGKKLVIGDLRFSISRRIIGPLNDRSRVVRNSSAIDETAVLWRSAVRIRNAAGLPYRGVARVREQGLHRQSVGPPGCYPKRAAYMQNTNRLSIEKLGGPGSRFQSVKSV